MDIADLFYAVAAFFYKLIQVLLGIDNYPDPDPVYAQYRPARREPHLAPFATVNFPRNNFVENQSAVNAEHRRREKSENDFSQFYSEKVSFKHGISQTNGVMEELSGYRHSDALDFAAMSWSWTIFRARRGLCRSNMEVPTFSQQTGIRAYYRVIAEEDLKYILLACHVNVHGFHRGDLRFVEVTERTITKGMETTCVIGKLFPGDIVAVTELCRVNDSPWRPPNSVSVNQESKRIWEVGKMTVMSRREDHVIFGLLRDRTAVARGFEEVMNVKHNWLNQIELSSLYSGKAFIPEKITSEFCLGFDSNSDKIALQTKSSCFEKYPKSLATIHAYFKDENESINFQIGVRAFSSNDFPNKTQIVETCTRMGYSAANSVFNGRFDSRSFPVKNARKEGLILRFSISNPPELPTDGRWNCNNRITIRGRTNSKYLEMNAVIETAIADLNSSTLQIVARLSRNSLKDLNFNDNFLVSQRECLPAALLQEGYFAKMKKEDPSSNGYRAIATLYGAPPLSVLQPTWREEFMFPNQKRQKLNDFQNEYVQTLLLGAPLILASSPFGCGKSMTIVTAAIEIFKRNADSEMRGKKKQQLLITQSNYASVNLVDIALKVKNSDLKFIRFISEKNWMEMPDASRTSLDMPHLMRVYFKKWATGKMTSAEIENSQDLDSWKKSLIVRFLIETKTVSLDDLTEDAKKFAEKESKRESPYHLPVGQLFKALRVLYYPDVIMITADSLQGTLSSKLFQNVSTIQIDEASQVPEYTIISLLSVYPNANFGLIGDIKQLPPYCEKELTGKLKDFGIGNTMERAIDGEMFPIVNFRYVYRCHPKITDLLSDLFYDGELISGITEDQRNEFITRRSDFWPNPDYPIAIIDNRAGGHRMGTSCGNHSEKDLVKRLVISLTQYYNGYKLAPSEIGVISFYSAQTAILTEAMRGTGVKCGTVDSFQGSERGVIILCCTNENISEFMQLGNRLNVAISRARQATIIIGNVNGLEKAKYWKEIVKRVEKNGCLLNTNLARISVRASTRTPYGTHQGVQNGNSSRPNESNQKGRYRNQRRGKQQVQHLTGGMRSMNI